MNGQDKPLNQPSEFDNDIRLLEQYQRGKKDALNELLLKYQKPLFGFICRRTNDFSISNDILQELTLKVIENIKRFKPEREKSFRQWLYQIAINLCNDHFRHRHKVRNIEAELKGRQMSPVMGNPVGENLMAEELLAHLPEEQKEVVLLKIYSGLTFQEIAQIMGCPLNTVISRMHYALKALRKKFTTDIQ